MSDYTASTIESQVGDIADFIDQEHQGAQKGVRNQLIMAGLISVILIGYFFVWINPALDASTKPPKLAAEITAVINQNVPDVAGVIEAVLSNATPKLADFVAGVVVDQGVPFITDKSREFLTEYISNLADVTEVRMNAAFAALLLDNKESFHSAVKEPNSEAATKLFQPVIEKMHTLLDQSRNKGEAKDHIDKAQIALHNLNLRLQKLAELDPGKASRQERLAQRLLSTWWKWMKKPDVADVESKPTPAGSVPTEPIEAPPRPPAPSE
jgi:F0F1-type ATP synthase assembly protein I